MKRRLSTLIAVAVPALLLVVLSSSVTVPLVAMGPGPTYDTLGTTPLEALDSDADAGEAGSPDSDDPGSDAAGGGDPTAAPESAASTDLPVIEVDGRDEEDFGGELRMTTVAVLNGLTLIDAMMLWLDPARDLVPRDQVFPPTHSEEEVNEANQAAMMSSEHTAEAAAYRHLDIPMAPRVEDVLDDSAASGVLRSGDVITAVGGEPTETADAVATEIGANPPGTTVTLTYERDGESHDTDIELREGPEGADPERGVAGITVADVPDDGTRVTINIEPDIGGPSAGMMFALGIIDKLTPGVLTGGEPVAGSGTVNVEGEVGPIGGIEHKIRAAAEEDVRLFLVPQANCADAARASDEGITVASVATLDDAVEAIEEFADGRTPQGCG